MLFGLGTHDLAYAKCSVGHYMVGLVAERLGSKMHRYRSVSASVGHFEEENLFFVQPDTYLIRDNPETLRRIVKRWPYVNLSKSIFLHHEINLRVGEVSISSVGRTSHNPDLHDVANTIGGIEFYRIAIGINYPSPDIRFQTPFALQRRLPTTNDEILTLNKFLPEYWIRLHEEGVPRVFEAVDKAVNDIRSKWPQEKNVMPFSSKGLELEYNQIEKERPSLASSFQQKPPPPQQQQGQGQQKERQPLPLIRQQQLNTKGVDLLGLLSAPSSQSLGDSIIPKRIPYN